MSSPGSGPPPVTLVTGAEQFLRERAVADVLARSRQADPEVDVSWLSAPQTTPAELFETLSPSLFAASRVAVLTELDQAADELNEVLVDVAERPPEGAVLVLVHPGGTKGKRLLDSLRKRTVAEVRCDTLRRSEELLDFVAAEARRHSGRVDRAAAARLVEVLGNDLRGLASMAEQLVADGEGRVSAELVGQYVDGRADVKGWTVADLTVTGQASRALAELRWALVSGTDAVMLVGALAGALRTLIRLTAVPRGQRDVDVAADLGVPAWKVRVLRDQLRGWTPDGLAQALRAVADADLAIKGGSTDQALALSEAVLAVDGARDAT